MPLSRRPNGMTLIELLVVISLIGILAGLVLFTAGSTRRIARDRRRVADLQLIHSALQAWKMDGNVFPTPADYNETGGGECSAYFTSAPTGWDCSFQDRNGNGRSFLDFLQRAPGPYGCPSLARDAGACPYVSQDPVDPRHNLALPPTQFYLYIAFNSTSGTNIGCALPVYILAARLETDGINAASNDSSCWNGQPPGSPANDSLTYVIVGG